MVNDGKYPFRDEETGDVVWLSFERAMQADCMGCTTYRGRTVRRARDMERERIGHCQNDPPPRVKERAEIVSDAMGFTEAQLPQFEADRKANGIRGIEFERDPDVPSFIRVRCDSREAFNRYAKHRGMIDRSQKNGSGASMTQYDFDQARERILKQYPAVGSLS
jgi:hypothetical protein